MNPIAKTLDQHKKANQEITATTGKMAEIYRLARERLNAKLQAHVLSGKNPLEGAQLVKLIEDLTAAYSELEEAFRAEFGRAIPYVAESYYFDALKDLNKSILGKPDTAKIELLKQDAFTHVAGMTQNMLKTDVAFLRQNSAEVFRLASATGITREEATQSLLGRILTRPEGFQFVDAGGRVWNNESYCQMLSRTVLLNAGRQTYFDTCAENGNDVVRVTVSGNPCPACAVWENRLLSISGATEGLPTVSQATAAGLCHPNCTHSFVTVGEFVMQEDFTADGRPKEGVNSPGREEKDDKEAWQKYRNSLKPQKAKKGPSAASKKKSAPTTPATAKPAAKSPDKPAKGTPEAVQPELPLDDNRFQSPDLSAWNDPKAVRLRELHNRKIMESRRTELESYARKHNMTYDEYVAEAEKKLQKMMDDASLYRRDNTDVFLNILNAGRFKSQFETNTSGGALTHDGRRKVEKQIWGYQDQVVKQRPIYGTVSASANGKGGSIDSSYWYGDIICKFKPEIRTRTTFTNGDSLGHGNIYGSCPVDNVNLTSIRSVDVLDQKITKIDHVIDLVYNEVQFHGEVHCSDIEKVFFEPSATAHNDFDRITQELKKRGIPFEILK